jgi:hypothetical protein
VGQCLTLLLLLLHGTSSSWSTSARVSEGIAIISSGRWCGSLNICTARGNVPLETPILLVRVIVDCMVAVGGQWIFTEKTRSFRLVVDVSDSCHIVGEPP